MTISVGLTVHIVGDKLQIVKNPGNVKTKRKGENEMDLAKNKVTLLIAGAILGVLAVILAATGNPGNMAFCIACFIRDSAGAMKLHQAAIVQYMRPEIAGLLLGAFVISLVTKEYRSTAGSSPMTRFILGFIMMVGALVFLGCPLRMIIRMSAGDLNAYVGAVGFVAGIFTGTLALKKGFSLGRSHETSALSGAVLPIAWVLLFALSIFVPALFAFSESGPGSMHAPVILALLAGIMFGIVAQRIRMCTIGGIRDVILMGNLDLFAILAGFFVVMLVGNIALGKFTLGFNGQPVAHAQHIWNFLGLYAVGFAGVLAGGCPLRQIILAGQGSSDAAVTFLGLFVGAAFCHNFGLASSAASAEAVGGPGTAGKITLIICIIVTFIIGFMPKKNK